MRPRRLGAVAAAALLAGLVAAPAQATRQQQPARRVVERVFDPSGVVSGARNATPFYGDLLGDWREEILAETDDHSALRLYTSTEPTSTRIHTLAQNPEYRLGWTVRGYLQSTYTDFYLGTETRRVPKPAITTPRIPAEGAVSHDDHA
ncbi:rhamnogalacturonan lyase family protein [Streptomyces sp. SAS_270]|uniref:rhamnogalacturonan lyase family protein n=1 Tax=Streptomyces sp. SAS_270 TaxID=3412748 RepID=UPI00403C8387